MTPLLLLPVPRKLIDQADTFRLPDSRLIALEGPEPGALRFSALRLQATLQAHAGIHWPLVAGTAAPREEQGIVLDLVPHGTRHPQGYELTISPHGIRIVAGSPAGIFYGVVTLIQIITQCGRELPCLLIQDWPDFPNRGVMLDISRDKVPTMETLYQLVDRLASWKINQFQLYTEHTFAYRQHPEVWAEASPMTGEEILALDAYCRERFVELIPNQNSFGHMHRWLEHDRYLPLAEAVGEVETAVGVIFKRPFSLCPLDPGSLELVRSLYDELLPHFSSRQFNVGLDETFDIGYGRSRDEVAELGPGRVYLDYLLKIYREVEARGRTMQFWGDIIVHYPHLVPELPRDAIALEWGYESNHPFGAHGELFARSGVPFYVCPGTSSWNAIGGRTNNALENLRRAAENGIRHGAVGFLNTDWGDSGHWQPLPVSYLGFAYGAGVSWAYEANCDMPLPEILSHHAFADPSGVMGCLAYDLGNAYLTPGLEVHNASVLFQILQSPPTIIAELAERHPESGGLSAEGLRRTEAYISHLTARLSEAAMETADAPLIREEFRWAADMMGHACRRGLWMLGRGDAAPDALAAEASDLINRFRELWHARNRPGGFRESVARMERRRADYSEQTIQTEK